MVWLLFLHIGGLVIWGAALTVLLLLMSRKNSDDLQRSGDGDILERLFFTRLASPAGLVAIGSGTLIFIVNRQLDSWLLLKLTLVTGLVVCHVTAGMLILYSTRSSAPSIAGKSLLLLMLVLLLMLSIVGLVLVKPGQEALLWFW
jgi:protoporphyrinogen IX oxidase